MWTGVRLSASPPGIYSKKSQKSIILSEKVLTILVKVKILLN